MLKYDEVIELLSNTKEITLCINNYLYDTVDDKFTEIVSLYATRQEILSQLKIFFDSKELNHFTQREREQINDLVQDIIKFDNQNIYIIDNKVNETKANLSKIQKQKSVLIYNKS